LSFHEILIPIAVAAIPMIGLLLSKRFEYATQSRGRIYERIEKVEDKMSQIELKMERLSGKLNGLDREMR
jgi:hypothetical protein